MELENKIKFDGIFISIIGGHTSVSENVITHKETNVITHKEANVITHKKATEVYLALEKFLNKKIICKFKEICIFYM